MTPGASERILVVDDQPELREILATTLRDAEFDVDGVGSGQAGLALASKTRPVVVLMEVALPDRSGLEVCRQLRDDPALGDLGVVLLSAQGAETDVLRGFDAGADDYVVKPFGVIEVVLRVKALCRRIGARRAALAAGGGKPALRWRGLELDATRQRAVADGRPIPLRPLERRLLEILLEHPGQLLSRDALFRQVWGASGERGSRAVDTQVRRLRASLGPYGTAIETVHGFGYRLKEASR